jgi:hypothetical protein
VRDVREAGGTDGLMSPCSWPSSRLPSVLALTGAQECDVIGVIDETAPELAGGVLYVVTAGVLLGGRSSARERMAAVLPSGRRRPFHWHQEGPVARRAALDAIEEIGVVAEVTVHPVGRRQQELARRAALRELLPDLVVEGVDHLIIESRTTMLDERDRASILDALGHPVPLTYEWRSKDEPLLWIADAIAGAVRDHLVGDGGALHRLQRRRTVSELRYRRLG